MDGLTIALPDVPGLRIRHYAGERDIPGMVAANMAVRLANHVEEIVTVDRMTNQYANLTNCDPSTDVAIVELEGRTVGYVRVDWSDQDDGSRSYDLTCILDPAVLGRGIGSSMLAWGESRLREIGAAHATDGPCWFGQETWDTETAAHVLLTQNGYLPVRTFFDMVRPTLDDIPDPKIPADFTVRPVGPDDLRAVWEAEMEAVRDHWGGRDESETAFARFIGDPSTDPSLFVVGFAGDEVAGAVRNVIDDDENELLGRRRGTLDVVFVRRPFRRLGLARALILRSLHLLRDRGMSGAGLGVDSENPNAALELYRSCGFEVRSSNTSWRKPFDVTTEGQT